MDGFFTQYNTSIPKVILEVINSSINILKGGFIASRSKPCYTVPRLPTIFL